MTMTNQALQASAETALSALVVACDDPIDLEVAAGLVFLDAVIMVVRALRQRKGDGEANAHVELVMEQMAIALRELVRDTPGVTTH